MQTPQLASRRVQEGDAPLPFHITRSSGRR